MLQAGSTRPQKKAGLHYMATDSAEEWDTFLDLPHCTWIRAGSRLYSLGKYVVSLVEIISSTSEFTPGYIA